MIPLQRGQLGLRLKRYYRPRLQVRYKHDLPHRVYLQNLNTYPSSETSTPPSPSSSSSTLTPELLGTERPLSYRLLRSVLWTVLFSSLGFAYVEVPKTVRWLDKSKRDANREEVDMQEIRQKFKDDPLVQILEADPSWHSAQPASDPETEPYPFVQHIDPYMSKAIGGSQGLQMKFYQNPSRAMMCCIVHIGEGVEWGPRTAHVGGLASLIEDSFDWLGSKFTLVSLGKSTDTTAIMSNKSIQIDFLKDVPTGQLYALWMLPAICLGEDIADVLNVKELRGPRLTSDELKRTVVGLLERRDSLLYEAGDSERYARARVTYDADTTKAAPRALLIM